jgi:prepilin-type N-terminal cleavage/methylation domain-containing protein
MERQASGARPQVRGYTLIELLVVMGIILMMILLAVLSVSNMLKSSRLSRTTSLIISAMDEARTAAVTLRRSTKVDLTRMDEEGRFNRLTVVGPFFNENFESYSLGNPPPKGNGPRSNGWLCSSAAESYVETDGSRCLRMLDGKKYWNAFTRIDPGSKEDYELMIQARIKFVPPEGAAKAGTTDRIVRLFGSGVDNGSNIGDAYQLNIKIKPTTGGVAPGRNAESSITLDRGGGALTPVGDGVGMLQIDQPGAPSKTTSLVQGVWYRMSLSVKQITDQLTDKSRVIVAGKVWADGALEPWNWTVGPLEDNDPLANGPGGLMVEGTDALADDVLIDMRPIRPLPAGVRIDTLDPYSSPPGTAEPVESKYYFPILFRPDGTSSEKYVIRITDLSSGDRRYVTIDQNTGRARVAHAVADALEK